VWCAIAAQKSYTDLLVARIFQGLLQAPVEAIVPSTISDIFFLHERGKMVGLYGLAVVGGNAIGPLISSFLVQGKGVPWRYVISTMCR
jgi:MFS family permease